MLDISQDVPNSADQLEVQAERLMAAHTSLREAADTRPDLRAKLITYLGIAANWYDALKPAGNEDEDEGEEEEEEEEEGQKTERLRRRMCQAELVRTAEALAGQLMNVRACMNAHTRLLVMEERVEREGVCYPEAWASWGRHTEALSCMSQDFLSLNMIGNKPDLHVKAVVEIMAEFWKMATGNYITQDFTPGNKPKSPAARFICEVLECCDEENARHLRSSVKTQMKKYVAALPEDVKRAAKEVRAANTKAERDAGKAKKKAERDAEKAARKAEREKLKAASAKRKRDAASQ